MWSEGRNKSEEAEGSGRSKIFQMLENRVL